MAELASLINLLFTLYTFLIIARVFMTWINISPYHPAAQWLYRLTEPLLAPIRQMLPQTGMVDWSPMVAMFLLIILRQIVFMLLSSL
jgi:YggT family protein